MLSDKYICLLSLSNHLLLLGENMGMGKCVISVIQKERKRTSLINHRL